MIIKGWTNRRDMCIISKGSERIDVETVVEMINAVKDGPNEGYIRRPGGTMFQYNRYTNGRIIVKQI